MNGRWEETDQQVEGPTVLVVGTEPNTRMALVRDLIRSGANALEVDDAESAFEAMRAHSISGLVVDQELRGPSGVEFLEQVRKEWPDAARVLVHDAGDLKIATRAINQAAVSYLLAKPWEASELAEAVARIAGRPAIAPEASPTPPQTRASATAAPRGRFPEIIGSSGAMRELMELVFKVADTDSTALITGETGTGKELIGRAIHDASRRSNRVFSAVNSAAFPETLLESELFGHRRGAFTGASSNSKGLFEHADKGTVFLDEVAEMPLSMQAKLLRFLQTGEIRPIGGEMTRYVDVRLVTATNKDLETEVAEGRFREDLYYRLAVIPVHVPPLRERRDDIRELAQHFLGRMSAKTGNAVHQIDDAAIASLISHQWPGNVRELENVIERAVALCRGQHITVEDLPQTVREPRRIAQAAVPDSIQSLPGMERRHILETLDRVGWNRKRAAALLEISTTTLWRRLKEFGIESDAHSREQTWTMNG